MGIVVMVCGGSGSGKSTSLRNFEPDEVSVFNVAGKPLPFRKKLPTLNNATYPQIEKLIMRKDGKKAYVIDDSQYLMAFESFDKVNQRGYDKFTEIAVNFKNLVTTAICQTPKDCIIYFLHHSELADDGTLKAKTLGKMLDNQLVLEGLFTIVLYTKVDAEGYWFITNSDGTLSAKSPMDMFPKRIPNDLKMVDATIREYYGLNEEEQDPEEQTEKSNAKESA